MRPTFGARASRYVCLLISIARENGEAIYYAYDDADRLTGETWKDAGGGTLYAFEWDYDAVGNRTYQKYGTVETYYAYDGANALARKHDLPANAHTYYAYDRRGNCVRIDAPEGSTYFEY